MLRDIRKVLVRVKESPGEQSDDFALNELSEIRRISELAAPISKGLALLSSLILRICDSNCYDCAILIQNKMKLQNY